MSESHASAEPVATEAAAEPQETAFAQRHGFATYTEMIGESQPVAAASRSLWYITPLRNGACLAWTVNALDDAHSFATFEEALHFVQHG